MSEIIILTDEVLRDFDSLQSAITTEGFPMALTAVAINGATFDLQGLLQDEPVLVRGSIIPDTRRNYPGRRWAFEVSLDPAATFASSIAAGMAGLAYARASGGSMYCGEDIAPSRDFLRVRQSLLVALARAAPPASPSRTPDQSGHLTARITRF